MEEQTIEKLITDFVDPNVTNTDGEVTVYIVKPTLNEGFSFVKSIMARVEVEGAWWIERVKDTSNESIKMVFGVAKRAPKNNIVETKTYTILFASTPPRCIFNISSTTKQETLH